MNNSKSYHSLYTPLLLFWVFSSLPRLWFYYRVGDPVEGGISSLVPTLLLGFLNDSLLIGILLLLVQVVRTVLFRHAVHLYRPFLHAFVALLTIFYGLMMLNVEFFRFFGSHATFEHMQFLNPTKEGLSLFLGGEINIQVVLFEVLLVPLSFVVLAYVFPSIQLDYVLFSRRGNVFSVALVMLGLFSHTLPTQNELQENLTKNSLLNFVRFLASGDELKGQKTESFLETLDTKPLNHPKIQTPEWKYVDPKYPLIKATDHHLCQLNKGNSDLCLTQDQDNDGYVLKDDCNDLEAGIHPNAQDIPRNGIDEDCSGLDADPPNVILIHWEGARAVNVGSIGYHRAATPKFDQLAKKGVLFRNAYANGIQTRFSLMSVYASILPRLSSKWIFKYNNTLSILGFPGILRLKGYETMYVHGASVNFASKRFRFKKWFEKIFDKHHPRIKKFPKQGWGRTDRDVLRTAYDLLNERTDERPFFMVIPTLAVHYPFFLPEPQFERGSQDTKKNQVPNLMRYSDDVIYEFISKIFSNPKFENTIFIIFGDHGLNRVEPHQSTSQAKLWEDLVWVPLLLVGKNWNLKPGPRDEIRSLADIGPTILDRLGIEVPNPYIGHSLLREFPENRKPKAFFGTANGGLSAGIRVDNHKYFVHLQSLRHRLFDMHKDREETEELTEGDNTNQELVDKLFNHVSSVYIENTQLIKENRIWNWSYWPLPRIDLMNQKKKK